MRLTLIVRALMVVALGAVAFIAPGDAGAVDRGRAGSPGAAATEIGQANFDGRTIDLKRGWEDAEACHVDEQLDATCYRSEREMDEALGIEARTLGDYPSSANGYLSCGSSLKLYSRSYYRTPVLYLTTRGSWTNMSWFGFDNITSSYKVGSCSATFRSGSYGGGSSYPGPTWAWARRSTMGWGWDNVLSSTFMY